MKDSESDQEKGKLQQGKQTVRRDWEGAIERQIRKGIERGEFENLPGRGKPLDLSREPNAPPELDLAFKLVKDAGFAPEWIEQDKEIRAARTKLFRPFQSYLGRMDEAQTDRAATEARLAADFRIRAAELNRMIDDFNLKAPSPRLHHARIRIELEVGKFREAIMKGQV